MLTLLKWPRYFQRTASLLKQSHSRFFTVLGLESSADDTCAAIVTSDRQILSNVVRKQKAELAEHSGIHPKSAIEAHQRNLPSVLRQALEEANMKVQDVDGIAFTRGPGMPGCLSVSGNAAKNIAAALNKPLVGVHHMQAHALTPLLTSPPESRPEFPFLTLLISGGHTMLTLAHTPSKFEMLCSTDISIGVAYDKVAKTLRLEPHPEYGLGAALESLCSANPRDRRDVEAAADFAGLKLVVPSKGIMAFSYTGLYSRVKDFVTERERDGEITPDLRLIIAHFFQDMAVAQLEDKIRLAFKLCSERSLDVRHLVASGGVASNKYVRKRLQTWLKTITRKKPVSLYFPPIALCTDNAAMIAWASTYRFLQGSFDPYTIDLRPDWAIDSPFDTY